jgi:hypothetical protein
MAIVLRDGFLTDLKTTTQTTNLQFGDLVGEINVGLVSSSFNFTRTTDTFTFNADYIVVSYEFTDGVDLDTKTRIVTPNIGQDSTGEYIGYGSTDIFPPTGNVVLTWGGDNTGNGFENVLINIAELKVQNPSATQVVIDMRALWYGSQGFNPVKASVTLYRGGTMVPDNDNYTFTNPTATAGAAAESAGTIVTAGSADSNGDRVSVLTYNLSTFVGTFNNNDTTTPEV